jgi:hypothetical protein
MQLGFEVLQGEFELLGRWFVTFDPSFVPGEAVLDKSETQSAGFRPVATDELCSHALLSAGSLA